jgi:phage FluMu protein Com
MSILDRIFSKRQTSSPNEVSLVRTDKSPDATYEIYKAGEAEAAKAFLLTKRVEADQYYIIVETPGGSWGLDKVGLYLERLLPFQIEPDAAECDGSTCAMPDPAGLEMAANGVNESFIIKIQCGNCQHKWLDAVRYQNKTAVRCPKCHKINRIDTTQIHRVTLASYPLFEKFLRGCGTDKERAKATSTMSSISLSHEILAIYPTNDSFTTAIQFADRLPQHFHPIAVKLKDGAALYVRCFFRSNDEYAKVSKTLKLGCAYFFTNPDEANIMADHRSERATQPPPHP